MRRLVIRCIYSGRSLDIKPDAECFFAGVDIAPPRRRIRLISRTKRGRVIDRWCDLDEVASFAYYPMDKSHKLYLELRIFDLHKLPREKAVQAVPWLNEQRNLALKEQNHDRWRERVS